MTAYDEMSNSNIVQVMKGLRKYEVLILIALFLENSRVEKVELDKLQERCSDILKDLKEKEESRAKKSMFTQELDELVKGYGNWKTSFLTTSMFREIVKRL